MSCYDDKYVECVILNINDSLKHISSNESLLPIIIAVSGKFGSGKDTVSDIIKEVIPSFKKASFAYRLKEVISTLTNTTIEDNLSHEGKSIIPNGFNVSLGRLQQLIGEGLKPILGDDIWANCLLYNDYYDLYPFGIISDLRLKVEANALKKRYKNLLLLRVEGDPANLRKENKANRDLNHKSEIDLDDYDFDYIIHNENITKDQLRAKIICEILLPFLKSLNPLTYCNNHK